MNASTITINANSEDWVRNPITTHRKWRQDLTIAGRSYADHSQRLYNSLFDRFCAWLSTQSCNLQDLTQDDLSRFIQTLKGRNERVAANRTQRTYVAEIDRVLAHMKSIGMRQNNPARAILETLRITTPLRPRSISLPMENTRELYIKSLLAQDPLKMGPEAIQTAAMNFLMLDCGLTLKELQKMVLKNLDRLPEGEVVAPGHRLLLARPIAVTAEAQNWLGRWLDIRSRLHVVTPAQYSLIQASITVQSGKLKPKKHSAAVLLERSARSKVFVSLAGKTGKANGLRGTGLAVDHLPESTIYKGAQDVLQAGRHLNEAEGLAMRNKGPQALRNRCCATKLAQGLPTNEIVAFLGLRRADQVWAMTRAMQS